MHTLTVHDLWQLQAELLAHHLNNAMPSDERIDYADLKNIDCLFNHWDENQYPDRPLDQMFTDAGIVLKMLEVWQDDTSRHMEAITC